MIYISIMWDDGLVSDLRLIDIIRNLGVHTSTFAISPSRHKKNRSVNDLRGDYGTLVSTSELKEFSDFEICNHGNLHFDLSKIDYGQTEQEIELGKKKLEDIYQKEVNGFCYPYGVYTNASINVLLKNKISYARITRTGIKNKNCYLLSPHFKWDKFDVSIIEDNSNFIIWGHTYEFRTENDWQKIKFIYEQIALNPKIKIINFEEMVSKICC